ncbi:hypothetical protein GGQ84_000377 [Desulfitispora alkaliphila]|uniref:sulfate reduction electron transfer complex DsrMKJOP subunit DsrJ n=1 Tax=Desulfitispora alkaliphila TaxID=622674 RepID=UPI003D1B5980
MSRKIIFALVALAVIILVPFWYNMGHQNVSPEISLNTPQIQALEEKECIEPTDYMRANHSQLLTEWRDSVVREGNRVYQASDGQEYEMCMQTTCLYCHSNKSEFCDACHDYVGAELGCWECHIEMQT